jgi:imidazolonepropionase
MKIVIKNINQLVQVENSIRKWVAGDDMNKLEVLSDAFVEIEDGIITGFGCMDDWMGIDNWNETEIIDANDGVVLPTFCDSHSHLVFAGNRETEWQQRLQGLSYEEIANNGGGILNSAKKLQETPEEELLQSALKRATQLIKMGTGAIEIKSGYGLSVESELKMLRVIKKLKEVCPLTIKATFLGAHAIPTEYKNDKQAYLDLVIDKMLPLVAEDELADYIDIFCEEGYFSVADTERLLEAGRKWGLTPKTHVNQFTILGGVQASVKHGALSVDHLEIMNNEDINALKGSHCMPTFLPACSFFLGIPYGPARKLIDNGLPIALASDYNPGSSPTGNMGFITSLGCIKMGLTPEESINATTINSAYAMGLSDQLGSVAIGKKANLIITEPISSYAFLPYSFGHNNIKEVIINGKRQ